MFKFVPFVVILWQTETKLNQQKKKTTNNRINKVKLQPSSLTDKKISMLHIAYALFICEKRLL